MTTIAFQPTPLAPFQFQAALDGALFNVIITWNVSRSGWYIGIYGEDGVLVVLRALIASPPDYPISMTAGYFTSTVVFLEQSRQFVISP